MADKAAAQAAGKESSAAPPPKVPKGERCAECSGRLPMTACLHSKCRCGKLFCGKHMHAHVCSFDYRVATQRDLREAMPHVAYPKM